MGFVALSVVCLMLNWCVSCLYCCMVVVWFGFPGLALCFCGLCCMRFCGFKAFI